MENKCQQKCSESQNPFKNPHNHREKHTLNSTKLYESILNILTLKPTLEVSLPILSTIFIQRDSVSNLYNYTWYGMQEQNNSFFVTTNASKRCIHNFSKALNFVSVVRAFDDLNKKHITIKPNSFIEKTKDIEYNYAIALKVCAGNDKSTNSLSMESVITRYKFISLIKKYLLNQGGRPKKVIAIQQYIQINQLYPEGILHTIEYLNDNYTSNMIDFMNSNVVSDNKLEETLVGYTRQIIEGLELSLNEKVTKVQAIYILDINQQIYLKTILTLNKVKKTTHDYSISRIGVKKSSTSLEKLAFLQSKLPNIPKTARNYLNNPFIGGKQSPPLVLPEKKLERDTIYYNKNYLPQIIKDSFNQASQSLSKLTNKSSTQDLSTQVFLSPEHKSPRYTFNDKSRQRNTLKLRQSHDKLNNLFKSYLVDQTLSQNSLSLDITQEIQRQLSTSQLKTLLVTQAVDQIEHSNKRSVSLLNLSKLTSDVVQKQDINKSLQRMYEKPQKISFSQRNNYAAQKRYEKKKEENSKIRELVNSLFSSTFMR